MIVRAALEDAGAVAELVAEAAPRTWSERAIRSELERADARVVIAKEDGAIVGAAIWREVLDESELMLICVHPKWRRKGHARSLFRELRASCVPRGIRRVHLEVRASNAPAIALYEALGFRVSGNRPSYYADPEEDAILMTYDA
jgi:[ribosomal protein S18]-alanine N-acetyltransferase